MLPRSLDSRLSSILGSKARELGCSLLVVGAAPDHVHGVVRLANTVSIADLLKALKGASAHELNADDSLKRRIVWQQGFWAESFGAEDLDTLARYVRRQRDHHDDSHPIERWLNTWPSER